ncbi:uncharacterized protein LOC129773576 [Toxorhynchites rutilus septentrionalis]|uniref:uncharacterized protein LOC129773576 n=1 Tax=Toxorhynchites rutilus septentrionalis TaxID=329112 RepID=UPI002479540E|nr:uncharacterized protein LOC129773576 [Toxorhynchites rutilus septentrionalis]
MKQCKSVSTPMEAGLQLLKSEAEKKLNKSYRELIGCLTYLMVTSRPDISAAVNYFSQFQSNPSEEHWVHAKRMLRYLRGTADHGLVYERSSVPIRQVVGFADSNWATDVNDRRSVSGILFKLYEATICWSTRKQSTVSLSSTEAECSALADAACEATWIQKVLNELGLLEAKPSLVYEDNQSTIAIMKSTGPSKRLKHTDVKIKYVSECVAKKKLEICYISTSEQQADLLTKGLSAIPFRKLCCNIGIFPQTQSNN